MNVLSMSLSQRLGIVFHKAAALLPGEAGRHLKAALTPEALATMAGVVALWAISHFVGVGEVADCVMLAVGWLTIGSDAVVAAKKLIDFAMGTHGARTEADLDVAARDLSTAVTTLGVDAVLAMLFKGRPAGTLKTVHGPPVISYRNYRRLMPPAGPFRMYRADIIFTKSKYAGPGATSWATNTATIGRNFFPGAKTSKQAAVDVQEAIRHERVHQRLTQAFSLLGRPAMYARYGAYKKSFILRYIEEVIAETWGDVATRGVRQGIVDGFRFPLNGRYGVSILKMGAEAKGIVLGPVIVGGVPYQAWYGVIHDDKR